MSSKIGKVFEANRMEDLLCRRVLVRVLGQHQIRARINGAGEIREIGGDDLVAYAYVSTAVRILENDQYEVGVTVRIRDPLFSASVSVIRGSGGTVDEALIKFKICFQISLLMRLQCSRHLGNLCATSSASCISLHRRVYPPCYLRSTR